jgi:hypothetical protein
MLMPLSSARPGRLMQWRGSSGTFPVTPEKFVNALTDRFVSYSSGILFKCSLRDELNVLALRRLCSFEDYFEAEGATTIPLAQ